MSRRNDLNEVEIAYLYLSGKSLKTVGREVGCSNGPVAKVCRKFGIMRTSAELITNLHPTKEQLAQRGRIEAKKVWRAAYGPIPKGHYIHHKDLDPTNNELDNLALLNPSEHSKLHWEIWRRVRPPKSRKPPRTVEIICAFCKKVCVKRADHANQKCCSRLCARELKRQIAKELGIKPKITLTARICPVCGRTYYRRRHLKFKSCSRKCGNVLRSASITEWWKERRSQKLD